MADYYPLIAKAIAGLEKNTGEARRALYERARTALVGQLRSMNPPLTESEITRERLGLEEAIRKLEAEAARTRPEPEAPKPKVEAPKAEGPKEPPKDARPPERKPAPPAKSADAAKPGEAERPAGRNKMFGDRPPLTDEGLKGFRDVVAEAESLGEATAQAAKSAREAYAAVPPPSHEFDRLEPRIEPEGLRAPVHPNRDAPERPRPPQQARPPEERAPRASEPPPPPRLEERVEPRPMRGGGQRPPLTADELSDAPRRSRVGLIAALLTVLIILGLGATAFWKRDTIAGLFNAVRGKPQVAQKQTEPPKQKIPDRVGQPDQQATQGQPKTDTQTQPQAGGAAVAQRVVLYEEDPSDPQGKRYIGSAIWRTEQVAPSPGAPPDLAVRADLEVPERRMTMTFTLRRNADQTLPASHTIELTFNLPADFPFGGIANVPGILMKQAEQTRGAALAGLAVKVTSGFFLVGLSAVETEMQRNMQLLKERSWFDIPIVYNNGRRAILAIEKGNPGERAFEDAFKAWGQ
jgi:hypothetical protein